MLVLGVTLIGAESSVAAASRSSITHTLEAPTSLTASSVGATTIVLTLSMTHEASLDDPISGYQYSLDGGITWLNPEFDVKTSMLKISGLNFASTYSIQVRALNSQGVGEASKPLSVQTLAGPATPHIDLVTVSTHTARVWFTTPANSGGATIVSYEYSLDGGTSWSPFSTRESNSPLTFGGLSDGQTYLLNMRAIGVDSYGSESNQIRFNSINSASELWYPFGPELQVPQNTLERNGWTQCFSGDYSQNFTSLDAIRRACTGDYLLLGSGSRFSDTFALVAAASRNDVFGSSSPHFANGNFWYFSPGTTYETGAWGFSRNSDIRLGPCDFATEDGDYKLCWKTLNGMLFAGYRSGKNTEAGYSVRRVVYQHLSRVPSAPVVKEIIEGDQLVQVTFDPASNIGDSAVAGYFYTIDNGANWFGVNAQEGSFIISGLSNGTTYSVGVRAKNAAGFGEPSAVFRVTPRKSPGVVGIAKTSVGDHQVVIDLAVPIDDGGSKILSYEYSVDSGQTWNRADETFPYGAVVISGLTNGTNYSVKLRAVNSVGSGAASDAVSVKPVAPASAPTISGVVAGNGQATLSITAPSQINDSSLSGYEYSTNNVSTWRSFSSVTGPFTITGLSNATTYQVKVRAVNSAGTGDASAAVAVTPTSVVPAKPVIGSLMSGNASAVVNITKPTDVTAQSITGYQYSLDKGATYQNAVVSNGSFTITGLTNGVSVSVQIRAVNFNGTSTASVSKSVIPSTTPAAPSITTVTPSAGGLSIAFTAPNTGGSAITCYQYSLDGGSTWVAPKTVVKTSPLKVTGLGNATTYPIKIRAVNANGAGAASSAVNATTPVLVPSAPGVTSIAKSSTTLTIDVGAPTSNGGAPITNYAYSVNNGTTWTLVNPASTSTRIVITGLKPNTLYPVLIAAVNSAGRGASSAKNLAITLR